MPKCAVEEPSDRTFSTDWSARCWLLEEDAKERYAGAVA
jgi:hypothetical protein